MASLSIPRRTTAFAIAGTVDELDAFAEQINEILGRKYEPRWSLQMPWHREPTYVKGSLSAVSHAIDLSKLKGFTVWVGHDWDDRHATVTADVWNLRADVWGESEVWAKEAASRVGFFLKEMRPWWWWLRTIPGAVGMTISINVVALLGLGLFFASFGESLSVPLQYLVTGISVIASLFVSNVIVPTLKVGARRSGRAVLLKTLSWLLGVVAAEVIGIGIGYTLASAGH